MKDRQQSQRKKQARALKKRTQRKLKLSRQKVDLPSPSWQIRQARSYPIVGCWAQRNWMSMGLVVVVIARRQPEGSLLFGSYMVDCWCLGLKNTFCDANVPPAAFHGQLIPKLFSAEPSTKITTELAHEIVYGGIEYARQLGFRPHRDFRLSQFILDPPDAHPRTGEVEFGKEGKPLYVPGPEDNAAQIIRRLTRAVGRGNFNFLTLLGAPPDDLWDDEWEVYAPGKETGASE